MAVAGTGTNDAKPRFPAGNPSRVKTLWHAHHFPRKRLFPQPAHKYVLGAFLRNGFPSEARQRCRVGQNGNLRRVSHAVVLLQHAQRKVLHRLGLVRSDAAVRTHLPNTISIRGKSVPVGQGGRVRKYLCPTSTCTHVPERYLRSPPIST